MTPLQPQLRPSSSAARPVGISLPLHTPPQGTFGARHYAPRSPLQSAAALTPPAPTMWLQRTARRGRRPGAERSSASGACVQRSVAPGGCRWRWGMGGGLGVEQGAESSTARGASTRLLDAHCPCGTALLWAVVSRVSTGIDGSRELLTTMPRWRRARVRCRHAVMV